MTGQRTSNRTISIVVNHRNRPELLRKCIASIQEQTLLPTEIVVVDDDSRAEVREEIRKFCSGDGIVLHENETNLGLPASVNLGVSLAKSEWVGFLADDDLYLPRKLELQSAYLDEHSECDILVGPEIVVNEEEGRREIWGYREGRQLNLKDALVHTAALFQTMLIRRELYLSLGGVTYKYLEDQDFGIRAISAGYSMHVLPEPLVIYRHGGNDQITRQWKNMFRAHLGIIRGYRHLLKQEFGALGPLQMYGRQFKKHGLRRGGLRGRSLWAIGCVMQFCFGNPFRAWDQ